MPPLLSLLPSFNLPFTFFFILFYLPSPHCLFSYLFYFIKFHYHYFPFLFFLTCSTNVSVPHLFLFFIFHFLFFIFHFSFFIFYFLFFIFYFLFFIFYFLYLISIVTLNFSSCYLNDSLFPVTGIPARRPVIEMTIPTSVDNTIAPPGKQLRLRRLIFLCVDVLNSVILAHILIETKIK